MYDAETIGKNLKRLRSERKMTAYALADRAGLEVSTIYRLERGKTARPFMYTLECLSTALHCSVSEITGSEYADE